MDHDEERRSSGAPAHKPNLDEGSKAVPDDFSNPAEATTEIQESVLEETLPGDGIPGFEGEEDGGG